MKAMNTQDNEARELVKRFVNVYPLGETRSVVVDALAYLARTEPKHPAKVAIEEWLANKPEDVRLIGGYLAGYRKGMEAAAGLKELKCIDTCPCLACQYQRRILNAAKEVPE